jgi:hypothetical protein
MKELTQTFGAGAPARYFLLDSLPGALVAELKSIGKQLLSGIGVVMEKSLGDTCLSRDVLEPDTAGTVTRDRPAGGLKDAFPSIWRPLCPEERAGLSRHAASICQNLASMSRKLAFKPTGARRPLVDSSEPLRPQWWAVRHRLADDTARIAFEDRPIMVRDDNVGVG